MDLTAEKLRDWTPVRVRGTAAEPIVEWCYTEGERFEDPFFDQSVERCMRRPFNLLFRHQTSMATVSEVAAARDSLPLAGLVFHCSRCGSTLISQMLAHVASVRMLSEPGLLDSVLSGREAHPEWLRWMVAALGRNGRPGQRRLVIKLDACAILHLPTILEAFPATPWIFVYRDPVEVLVSQLGHWGYRMIPGGLPPDLLGLDPGEVGKMSSVDYMACVLGALLSAAALSAPGPGRSLLVNYRELPGVVGRIAEWFGIDVTPADEAAMTETAGCDAKNPFVVFDADSARKQDQATETVRRAAATWAQPWYQALEHYREGQR